MPDLHDKIIGSRYSLILRSYPESRMRLFGVSESLNTNSLDTDRRIPLRRMNPPPANGKAIIGIPRVIKDSSGVLLIFVLSLCTYFYLKEAAKAIHPFGKAALEAGKAEGNAAGNLEAEDAYKGKYISISMKFAHAELLSISLIAVSAITLIYQSGKSFRAIARYRPEEPEGKK